MIRKWAINLWPPRALKLRGPKKDTYVTENIFFLNVVVNDDFYSNMCVH